MHHTEIDDMHTEYLEGLMVNPIDAVAADISANATPLDIAAARQFLDVNAADGRRAALDTSGAGHLIRKYKINRNLGAICRRIVADHEGD